MRRKTIDPSLERRFITAMVVSKQFLTAVAPAIDLGLLRNDYTRQIAEWCVDYFNRYGKAPRRHIENIYHAWAENEEGDSDLAEAVHDVLSDLSGRYRQARDINVPFLVDEFAEYLKRLRLERVRDNLEYALLRGDVASGVEAVNGYQDIHLGQGVGFDLLNDKDAWARAFAESAEPLLKFPGDAGKFFGHALSRESLIGVQGPEKRGKTYWCVEFVIQAVRARCKVALFEVGDLTESQILKRFGVRLARTPMWRSQRGTINVPVKIRTEKNGKLIVPIVYHKPGVFKRRPTERRSFLATQRFSRLCGLPKGKPYLMASVHANSSINVAGIESILQQWRLDQDFVPDVIIIDYPDILLPEAGQKDVRHQIDQTWRALRRLSQEQHCLVIAPTQATRTGYKARTQQMSHASEDKRKLAHVTGMLGLNQTDEEKNEGVMRLNWIVLREQEFFSEKCLFVAQCLPLARAFCCASF